MICSEICSLKLKKKSYDDRQKLFFMGSWWRNLSCHEFIYVGEIISAVVGNTKHPWVYWQSKRGVKYKIWPCQQCIRYKIILKNKKVLWFDLVNLFKHFNAYRVVSL